MKICVICPVRNGVPGAVVEYVAQQEKLGHIVHFPPRDNPQDDPIGNIICQTMVDAISNADTVALYYDPTSQGVHFDLGIAFVFRRPIMLLNPNEELRKSGKSYLNVAAWLSFQK